MEVYCCTADVMHCGWVMSVVKIPCLPLVSCACLCNPLQSKTCVQNWLGLTAHSRRCTAVRIAGALACRLHH